jgi:hypothetical protein
MAYNPTSSGFSYHGPGNREMTVIDFYTNQVSAATMTGFQREARFYHGIGMFLTWWYDDFITIELYIISYLKFIIIILI